MDTNPNYITVQRAAGGFMAALMVWSTQQDTYVIGPARPVRRSRRQATKEANQWALEIKTECRII